jgi:hypothetical protein
MLPITLYLIENPLVAIGLGMLMALCVYNVLRRQVRVAMGLWVLMLVVLFYIYSQVGMPREDAMDSPSGAVGELAQP